MFMKRKYKPQTCDFDRPSHVTCIRGRSLFELRVPVYARSTMNFERRVEQSSRRTPPERSQVASHLIAWQVKNVWPFDCVANCGACARHLSDLRRNQRFVSVHVESPPKIAWWDTATRVKAKARFTATILRQCFAPSWPARRRYTRACNRPCVATNVTRSVKTVLLLCSTSL